MLKNVNGQHNAESFLLHTHSFGHRRYVRYIKQLVCDIMSDDRISGAMCAMGDCHLEPKYVSPFAMSPDEEDLGLCER